MNVSDYIIDFLQKKGLDTVFLITGGQAMFLDDAVYRNKKIKYICMHHEQAVGMAAEAYGRITGKLGIALITAGPASINILNGLVGAWVDSSPMIVISGQSSLFNVQYQENTQIRQYGIQGINIKPLVEKVTKYFVTVDDPLKIKYYLQKAYFMATKNRPGPVWIDVPLDIQRMEVPNKQLEEYVIENSNSNDSPASCAKKVLDLIVKSKRPIFLVGHGVDIAQARKIFYSAIKQLNIPVLTSRLGIDLIDSNNRLFVGRPGTYGQRSANLAVQNTDLIIAVGSRLASAMIGHNFKDFGRNAINKIVIDNDPKELAKPSLENYIKYNCDAGEFFNALYDQIKYNKIPNFEDWIKICNGWKNTYPTVIPSYAKELPVNSYYFTERLSNYAKDDEVILVDTGTCFHVACQTWNIKNGQKFITTGGISTMGYWAAGIGACLANNKKRVVIITGDGSLQFNLQEFATIKYNRLPLKIFIFNNNGYLLIRQTQTNFMNKRLIGEGPKNGVWCPDSLKIAKAYGIKGVRINSVKEVDDKIKKVLKYEGPVICDVMTPQWQQLMPRTASYKDKNGALIARPYEDMFPFLSEKELKKNMVAENDDA